MAQVEALPSHQADGGGRGRQGEDHAPDEPHPQGQGHAVQGGGDGTQQPPAGYGGRGPRRLGVRPREEAEGHLHDLGLWGTGVLSVLMCGRLVTLTAICVIELCKQLSGTPDTFALRTHYYM